VKPALRIVALGGLGEVGMNCLAVECEGRVVVIDCGVTFPDHEPGIDVIHPDFDFLCKRAGDVEAVILTHGHEDHIGALPYLLPDVNVPIYGPPYALALVQERLREADLEDEPALIPIKPRAPFALGPFHVTPFRVTHSIPDSIGLVLRTPAGTLVHSGDFKIDRDPLDGEMFDEDLLAEVGREGVRVLLSDSTNSEVDGCAGGERPVVHALQARIAGMRGRVVIGMFASNVLRVGAVLDIARACGRRVLFLGRALHTHARVADSLQILPHASDVLVDENTARTLPRDQLLVLATGSQGEERAALRRLASGTHPALKLEAGDDVVLSSRVIPGRERAVFAITDDFERQGVRVWTRRDDGGLHVSGHACRDEQQRMIELTRPRAFVPVHGSFVHLKRHADLARSLGVPEPVVVENGTLVEIDADGTRVAGEVQKGRVHIQHGGEITYDILRDRRRLAEGGVVTLVLNLGAGGILLQPPDIAARGVIEEEELIELGVMRDARDAVTRALRDVQQHAGSGADDAAIELAVTRAARRVMRDAIGWKPSVQCIIQRTDA
jgi:ribonuclease J